VVDHVIPLACGGPDEASNMQWQSVKDAKKKDKVERSTCGKVKRLGGYKWSTTQSNSKTCGLAVQLKHALREHTSVVRHN
jgi:hypothetical protein